MKKWIYNHTFLTPLIVGVLIFVMIFSIEFFVLGKQDIKILNILEPSNLILFLTLIAILWYSLETKLLKNATNIANSINVEPLLVLQSQKERLFIKNYGKGIAFNIAIEKADNLNSFDYFIGNHNPLGDGEEKDFIPKNENSINQNIKAEIVLLFSVAQGDDITQRKRKYEIQKVNNGWSITFLG